MNKNQIKQYAEALGIALEFGASREQDGKWLRGRCPLAKWRHDSGRDSNPSFGIKIENNKSSFAHCFSCGFHGDLYDLAFEIQILTGGRDYDYKTAFKLCEQEEEGESDLALAGFKEEEDAQEPLWYFDEGFLESFPPCHKNEDGRCYNESRGVPVWLQKELNLRYDTYEGRVIFPVRDFNGDLVGLHGRQIDGEDPVYRVYTDTYPRKGGHSNPQVWYGEDRIDLDEPIVVVESVYDYTKVIQVYENVISPLTASLTLQKISRLEDALYLVKMFDGDKAGKKASWMMKNALTHVEQREINLPDGTDPGGLTKQQIRKYLSRYIDF